MKKKAISIANNRVFNNASWIIGCKLAQSAFALLINALTARYFGPTTFGLINYAASLVAFVTPIMTLGTTEVLVNEIIRRPQEEGAVLGTSIVMTFVSSLCCIGGIYAFVRIAHPGDNVTLFVTILYSLLLIAQCAEQIQYWFHAKFLSKYVSLTSFFVYVVISAYKMILLVMKKSVYWFAVSNSLDYLLIAIALCVLYYLKAGQKLSFSLSIAKSLWNAGKHYIIPGLMGLVLAQSDRVMLRFMCGETEVGFYSAAISIATLSSFVFSALITSFRPSILEAKTKNIVSYETELINLYSIVIYMSLAIAVGLTILALPITTILYGDAFEKTSVILRIAVWYTPFSYIGGVRMVYILAEDKQQYLWIISLTGMMLNIALNLIFIPQMSGYGAALATTITQIFTNVVIVYLIKPIRKNLSYVIKGFDPRCLLGICWMHK